MGRIYLESLLYRSQPMLHKRARLGHLKIFIRLCVTGHRQTKWCSRTLSRRLVSWHYSSNSKPDQSGPYSIPLIPRTVLIWQACYRSQACQANAHRDLGCKGKEPFRSGARKLLEGQLVSRRDKILQGHCGLLRFAGLLTIFTGKIGLPNLARHFSASFVQAGYRF